MLVGGALVLVLVLRRRSRMTAEAFEPDDDVDDDGPRAPRATAHGRPGRRS